MKVKKYLSLLLAVVMIASVFSTTAFASESELPVNEVIIGGDSLEYRAPNPPTLFYNLGGSGQYTATLIDLAANRGSYTKYYFATSTGEIYLKFDLERSGTTTQPCSAAKLAAEMNVNSGTVSRNLYGLFKMGYLETRGDGERVNYITRLDNLEQVFHWVAEYIGGIG